MFLKFRWLKQLIPSFILLILLQGCGIGIKSVGIGIIDIESNHTLFLASKEYREVIVNVDHSHNLFRTFQQLGENSVITEISLNGRTIKKTEIPIAIPAYWNKDSWSIAPNGKAIIYFDPYAYCLRKFDLLAFKDETIFPDIATGYYGIRKIFWLSNEEILIVLGKDKYRNKNEILIFDIEKHTKKTIIQPDYLDNGCYSLSPTKRYFTYREKDYQHSINGKINIIDLASKTVIAQIEDSNLEIRNVCWDQKGVQLAYKKRNTIYSYTIMTSKSEIVKTLPKDLIIYDLIFFDVNKLAYKFGKSPNKKGLSIFKELHLIDLTGKEIWKIEKQFWGDIFPVNNGKKVLCELGYVNLF